jgi:hypothetical protein
MPSPRLKWSNRTISSTTHLPNWLTLLGIFGLFLGGGIKDRPVVAEGEELGSNLLRSAKRAYAAKANDYASTSSPDAPS